MLRQAVDTLNAIRYGNLSKNRSDLRKPGLSVELIKQADLSNVVAKLFGSIVVLAGNGIAREKLPGNIQLGSSFIGRTPALTEAEEGCRFDPLRPHSLLFYAFDRLDSRHPAEGFKRRYHFFKMDLKMIHHRNNNSVARSFLIDLPEQSLLLLPFLSGKLFIAFKELHPGTLPGTDAQVPFQGRSKPVLPNLILPLFQLTNCRDMSPFELGDSQGLRRTVGLDQAATLFALRSWAQATVCFRTSTS